MKKISFDEEELFAIAVFDPDTRAKTVTAMEVVMPLLTEDPDMSALVLSAKEKLRRITDEEFKSLQLEVYREELRQAGEEEEEENPEKGDGNK